MDLLLIIISITSIVSIMLSLLGIVLKPKPNSELYTSTEDSYKAVSTLATIAYIVLFIAIALKLFGIDIIVSVREIVNEPF